MKTSDSGLRDDLNAGSRLNDLILSAVGDGIYGLDRNGLVTFVNPAATRMTGWLEVDLLGEPMHEMQHHTRVDGSPYPRHECPIYAALTDGKIHTVDNEVFWHANGSAVPVEYTSTPILKEGKPQGAVVVFRDISNRLKMERERKADHEELNRLKTMYQLILDSAGEGIYGKDAEGRFTFGNKASQDILGWKIEDVLGKVSHAVHHHSYPDGSPYPRENCLISTSLKKGQKVQAAKEVFWHSDGSMVPVEYTSTPIIQDGKIDGAVLVFRDISERIKSERKLLDAYAEVANMKEQLEAENSYLQEEINVESNYPGLVGHSPAMQHILNQIELVAPTEANVLVNGESGTGKELIARAIHEKSDRHKRPLIRVNCAAIPRELFESEFFGHVRGAFTGAIKDRIGRFELADGGTIFLDEVGEIPLELQSKLLRVLQEGQIERVGEEKTRNINVRVIAATNRNLKADTEAKLFREDLYFRLNVFPIEAVPLRSRKNDISSLATHFISKLCARNNRSEPRLTQANVKQLQLYHWPGNIRELQNVIERAIIISRNGHLRFDLPTDEDPETPIEEDDELAFPYAEEVRLKRDRDNILRALKVTGGRISGKQGAAILLGIGPTTLASRMTALKIKRPR